MCGGHPAFSTKKRDSAAIVVSQDEEETQLPTSKRQCLSSEDITKSAVELSQDNPSIEKTSRNRVIILHRGYEASPQIVCIRPDEPINGLVIAETKLQQPVQPFRVCDILGQSFGQSNRPQAFQHVFLHDQGPRSSQPCHDACQPPHWFDLMETCSRIKMLYRQEAWIAKDEMDFYIQVFPVSGIARGIPSLVFDDLPGQFEDSDSKTHVWPFRCRGCLMQIVVSRPLGGSFMSLWNRAFTNKVVSLGPRFPLFQFQRQQVGGDFLSIIFSLPAKHPKASSLGVSVWVGPGQMQQNSSCKTCLKPMLYHPP